MKRKFYFAVVILLVAVMALCLVACGETDDNLPSGDDTGNTGGTTTPPKDTKCVHSYGEWRVKTPATCTADRVEIRICSKCGDTEQRTVSGSAGHTFGAWTVKIAATCGEDRTDSRKCTACGYEETQKVAHTATGRHEYNDGNVCTVCGANKQYDAESEVFMKDGDVLYFGSYPQSRVTDESLLENLSGYVTVPTENDSNGWTLYDFYVGGEVYKSVVENYFTWYQDVEYDGAKYRAVYFILYRYVYADYSPDANGENSRQYENGYRIETVYWFKYEPIKWKIVKTEAGLSTIVAESVLDVGCFYKTSYQNLQDRDGKIVYANDYAESYIRAFLNGDFYETAFNSLQRSIVQVTAVDNSWHTAEQMHDLAYADTNDNVYLLSYKDITEFFADNEARKSLGTDYAKVLGINEYQGGSPWWSRSPSYWVNGGSCFVASHGATSYTSFVNAYYGVRPAMTVKIVEDCEVHTYATWHTYTEATCGDDRTEYSLCDVCGHREDRTVAGTATGNHNYVSVCTVQEATCQEDRIDICRCSVCGYEDRITIPNTKTDHDYTVYIGVRSEATCKDDRVDIYGCRTCEATEDRVAAGTKTDNHVYVIWEAYEEATCTKNATEKSTCTVCGKVGYREVENSMLRHIYGDDDKCTGCGKDKPPYTRDGDVIYFGSYPQTAVTGWLSDDLTRTATRKYGTPTAEQHIGWEALGSNWWYKDLEYGGAKYRGMRFKYYRPLDGRGYSATSSGWQEKNGYETDTMYWFKFEPIKWRILKEADGKAMLISDVALDSQVFDDYTAHNNYAESGLRKWLNQTFYDYAFTLAEKDIILKTIVDNSLATTCDETNPNVCEDTEDNVFLLSKYEATLYITDVNARFVQTTDYTKARGIATYDDNCCDWWLRSPDPTESKEYAYLVMPTKTNWWLNICPYYHTSVGVVPAMWITL